MTGPAFDINKSDGSKPSAMLPMLGMPARTGINEAFPIDNVDGYLAALHASIGDAATLVRGNILEAAKALGSDVPQAFSYANMAFMPDPTNYGLVQWPGLPPESLRKISRENIAPQMVIRSRVTDLARYAGLSSHLWMPGWRIVMMDPKKTPTAQDRLDIKAAESFIWNCSREHAYTQARERDTALLSPFGTFLRTFADDSLTFDGWAIWTDRDSKGGVRAFCNLPSGMIRLAIPTKGYKGHPEWFACMVDETGNPIKPFTRDELVWRVRNPRLDPAVMGYGWSEIEIAVRIIQGFQAGIDLNVDTFTKSAIPNGMLLLKGDYFNQDQIDALMREWTNMKRGISKLWGMPVMAIPEGGDVELMQFMDMKGEDVRYKDHLNMMAGLCCIIYNFPVRRLGMFVSGNHRDNAPVQDAAVEIQGADDSGLPALLEFLEDGINPYLLWSNWPQLRFEFVNKNPKVDARSYEFRKQAMTWGEARAEADLPKLTTVYSGDLKPLAEIMEGCPEDPAKSGVFQTVAVTMLQNMLGMNDGEGDEGGSKVAKPGPRMLPKKDPAASLAHGHASGIRRDSKAEATKGDV